MKESAEIVKTIDVMDIQELVKVAVTLAGKERHVNQNAIKIAKTINATKIMDFAQLDANWIGMETNVIDSVHRSAKRLVIDF